MGIIKVHVVQPTQASRHAATPRWTMIVTTMDHADHDPQSVVR